MQLTSILQTTAANWVKLTVMMSIERMKRDCWVNYYLASVDTLKYILKDIFICIIEEQRIDEGESTWRWYTGCQNKITDVLGQIKRQHIEDTPMARWASTEHQRFLVLHHWQSVLQSVETIDKCAIGWHYRQKSEPHDPCPILKLSVNGALTTFGLVSWEIQNGYGRFYT